ncbi:MAG: GldG family protein [Chitinispirillaceae bacterium]|nr:GldG family protein [Chitinispirillaceae bacterium]
MEKKKIKTRMELAVYSLIILGMVMVVNYLSTLWFKRLDLTEGKEFTVSAATKNIMKSLDDIINVKVYCSKNLPQQLQKNVTDIRDMLAEYKAYAGKKLRVSWVDPTESENGKQEARTLGINEMQMQTIEKDKAQVINGYLGIVVLFADRKEVIPFVQNLQNFEYDLTLAIMKVARPSTPNIGILKVDTLPDIPESVRRQMGDRLPKPEERTDVKFSRLFEKLGENYGVVTVTDIAKGTPVDSTLKALIVPGAPAMNDRSLFEIDQYFMKSGKLIVFAPGMRIDFHKYYGPMPVNVDSKLLDLLKFYGVKIEQNMVVDASCGQVQIPQKVGPFTMNVAVPYPYFVRIGADGFNRSNPAVSTLSDVVLPWPSSLTLLVDQAAAGADSSAGVSGQSGIKAAILSHSSKKSWIVSGTVNLDPQQNWQAPADMKPATLAAHLTGNFKSFFAGKPIPPVGEGPAGDSLSSIALQPRPEDANRTILPSNTNGHLVVVGSDNFVASQNAAPANIMLAMNLADWLTQDENLIAVRTRALQDRTIEADLLKKGSATPNIVRFVNIITMPFLVIMAGIFIFLRRRKAMAAVQPTSPAGAP